jgi:hypothetical protein
MGIHYTRQKFKSSIFKSGNRKADVPTFFFLNFYYVFHFSVLCVFAREPVRVFGVVKLPSGKRQAQSAKSKEQKLRPET